MSLVTGGDKFKKGTLVFYDQFYSVFYNPKDVDNIDGGQYVMIKSCLISKVNKFPSNIKDPPSADTCFYLSL